MDDFAAFLRFTDPDGRLTVEGLEWLARAPQASGNDVAVSVLDYGAVANGDGAGGGTESVTAIQSAIDAVAAAGGGEVEIPRAGTGIYRIRDVAIEMRTGVTVRVAPGVQFDNTGFESPALLIVGIRPGDRRGCRDRASPVQPHCHSAREPVFRRVGQDSADADRRRSDACLDPGRGPGA